MGKNLPIITTHLQRIDGKIMQLTLCISGCGVEWSYHILFDVSADYSGI